MKRLCRFPIYCWTAIILGMIIVHGQSRDFAAGVIFALFLEAIRLSCNWQVGREAARLDLLRKVKMVKVKMVLDDADALERIPFGFSSSDVHPQDTKECRCTTLSHKLVEDGCDICNPEMAAEVLRIEAGTDAEEVTP